MVKHTERTWYLLLKQYGLEPDSNRLWKAGVRNQEIVGDLREDDLVDFRLKGTWAQYCNMYKQETGKDHQHA